MSERTVFQRTLGRGHDSGNRIRIAAKYCRNSAVKLDSPRRGWGNTIDG